MQAFNKTARVLMFYSGPRDIFFLPRAGEQEQLLQAALSAAKAGARPARPAPTAD